MELIVATAVVLFFMGICWVMATLYVGGDPFFFLRKRVYLLDYWGKIRLSRERRPGIAYVYPSVGVGLVILNSDGTTGGVPYIKRWSYKLEDLT